MGKKLVLLVIGPESSGTRFFYDAISKHSNFINHQSSSQLKRERQ